MRTRLVAIAVSSLAIVGLSDCVQPEGKTECELVVEEMNDWLGNHQKCEQDSDCGYFTPGVCTLPPMPCGGIYNKAAWDPYVTSLTAEYKSAGCFPHSCPTCPLDSKIVPTCSNHLCIAKPT